MNFTTLAGTIGGGLSTPGFVGHGKYNTTQKKFVSAEGGLLRMVWMPKMLKEELAERLKNSGECGVPTGLAFAMNLAARKVELTACPHVSEEAKTKLSEAAAPPIRVVTIGVGDKALKIGGETVMFRHEKRFENPPGFAMLIKDTMDDAEINSRLERAKRK